MVLIGTVFTAMSIYLIVARGPSWSNLLGAVLFGSATLVTFFKPEYDAWLNQRMADRLCRIEPDGFYFKHGYDFRYGAMARRKLLPYGKVQEIRLNTWPPTALVNGNELIFLTGLKREEVATVAEQHGIRTCEPLDIWELIGEEFLDTEFEEAEKRHTLQRISEAGVPEQEVFAIRKRLRWWMLPWGMYSMEWIYCGQYDMLRCLWPMRAKTYWWSMEISLRAPQR